MYACGRISGRKRLVVNISNGLGVGVWVGVFVRVGVTVGLGVVVHVGEGVELGMAVEVLVALGMIFVVGEMVTAPPTLQEAKTPAIIDRINNG